jgi:phosphoribosylformimino-5-aminoimidazole carboxamide ribotide isomerase
MTKFRPCIDLHDGCVKQIVGGTLRDDGPRPTENFVADQTAGWFADRYRADGLTGGHLIKLGPGNDAAAREALAAYPGGLQIGGGITAENAPGWLEAGASHVIVTSWLFDSENKLSTSRLQQLTREVGRERIVLDLSCRRVRDAGAGGAEQGSPRWRVAMNRWQTLTDLVIDHATLDMLADYADEFLIHAADVEGLCQGIDAELVAVMGGWGKRPMTYAGGATAFSDLEQVDRLSQGRVDLTVGSALDLFGGHGVRYADLLAWNRRVA